MVARGDLGAELAIEEVPLLQASEKLYFFGHLELKYFSWFSFLVSSESDVISLYISLSVIESEIILFIYFFTYAN